MERGATADLAKGLVGVYDVLRRKIRVSAAVIRRQTLADRHQQPVQSNRTFHFFFFFWGGGRIYSNRESRMLYSGTVGVPLSVGAPSLEAAATHRYATGHGLLDRYVSIGGRALGHESQLG